MEGLSAIGDKAIGNESTHQPMVSPLVNPGLMDLSPTNAQSCISSGCTDQPSLSSSKGLGIPVSHDENAHHVDLHNPYQVPPPTSKAKPSRTIFCAIKYLLARTRGSIANDSCRACAVPNIHMVHYHELCPEFLSQSDVSCDVLGESKLLQETVSDVSEYMLHETSITTDSGYHSSHPTVRAHLDASNSAKALVSTNKVPCPSSQSETLVNLPSKMDEILSQYCVRTQATQRLKYQERCCLQHPLQG